MGKTQTFGFNTIGPNGRLSDEAFKFSDKDRHTLDALLTHIYSHDHQLTSTTQMAGPSANAGPNLTLATTGGNLAAGRTLFYKVSFMDTFGNETEASVTSTTSTPNIIGPPGVAVLSTATTGGTLNGGTYKYAIAYYQSAGGQTTAPTINTINVATGSTNTVTLDLGTLPDGVTGWRIFRRSPGDDDYYLLDSTVTSPYVDDGSVSPDCTKKRPSKNTTNSTNKITISINPSDLPLDSRIGAWRIYRTSVAGVYGNQSLLATVVETTTEGGSDLVTSYEDIGQALSFGVPLAQSAVPPSVPQLDPARVFLDSVSRLPAKNAPLGVSSHQTFMSGELASATYNQFSPPHDMFVNRIDAFTRVGVTGVDGSNYVTIRVSDDATANEIQSIWTNAEPQNEVQFLSTNASGGTFTLGHGADVTDPIDWNATAATVETRIETDLTGIADVMVGGSGTPGDPWIIIFVDPGGEDVAELIVDDALLTGGTATIFTSIDGSDGGTFTLSDGTDTTDPIAWDAVAGTIETRLETDITAITDVTVTGTGTEMDPWVVTFVNPGSTDFPELIADNTSLNGSVFVVETQEGYDETVVDVICDVAGSYFFWQSSLIDYGELEGEDATGDGVFVSDNLAGNDAAVQIETFGDVVTWSVGTLDQGDYVFRVYASAPDGEFDFRVVDLNGPTTLSTSSHILNRSIYTPPLQLKATLDGTEDIQLVIDKTDAFGTTVRVDRFEYQVSLPVLHGGSNVTVEAIVTGSPTTNGEDVNVGVWF